MNLINEYFQDSKMENNQAWMPWDIYVDGEDPSITSLIQEGNTARNCGVYCACYMLNIALHSNINTVLELFENKLYHTLFSDINPNTILYKRKLLSVMIADAELIKLMNRF